MALAGALQVNQTLQTLLLSVSAFYFLFLFTKILSLHQGNPVDAAGLIQIAECLKHNQSLTFLNITVEYFLASLPNYRSNLPLHLEAQ